MLNRLTTPEGTSIMEPHEESKGVRESCIRKYIWIRSAVTTRIKFFFPSDKIYNLLIPCVPLACLVNHLTNHHGWVFFLSFLGIVPLAERLRLAIEQLAFYTGPKVGDLLNATFDNATELIIAIHAMKQGMLRVVQQSLLGSILSNMLLVLGCSFFSGGIVHINKGQVFNKSNAVMCSGLLLIAVMGLMFPSVLHFTHTELILGTSELALSRFSSCIMLIAYGAYLTFQPTSQSSLYSPVTSEASSDNEISDDIQLTSQSNLYSPITSKASSDNGISDDEEPPDISKYESIIWLSVLIIVTSVLSKNLVDTIEGASVALNTTVSFISVILLPIVGNAAENFNAIMFAMEHKLDLSLGVTIGSSTQIAIFVIPSRVVVGWIIGCPLDLNFQLFETATLSVTVLLVAFMLQEGTSNYFKGIMLMFCYLIVAASFFVHIDPQSI